MSVKIEKFVGDKVEKSFNVPDGLITFANSLLPRDTAKSLQSCGVNLYELAQARRAGKPYASTITIKEGGVTKTVKVTAQ